MTVVAYNPDGATIDVIARDAPAVTPIVDSTAQPVPYLTTDDGTGPSNTAKKPSPAVSSSLPWNRANSRRTVA